MTYRQPNCPFSQKTNVVCLAIRARMCAPISRAPPQEATLICFRTGFDLGGRWWWVWRKLSRYAWLRDFRFKLADLFVLIARRWRIFVNALMQITDVIVWYRAEYSWLAAKSVDMPELHQEMLSKETTRIRTLSFTQLPFICGICPLTSPNSTSKSSCFLSVQAAATNPKSGWIGLSPGFAAAPSWHSDSDIADSFGREGKSELNVPDQGV